MQIAGLDIKENKKEETKLINVTKRKDQCKERGEREASEKAKRFKAASYDEETDEDDLQDDDDDYTELTPASTR
jgi:hypothetical protein